MRSILNLLGLSAGRLRTFCIMGQRLTLRCKVKPTGVAVAKASLNRAIE